VADDTFLRDRDHGAGLPHKLTDGAYERIADWAVRRGHPIWEIRESEPGDGGDAVLVRKQEEREVDLRTARAVPRRCLRRGDRVASMRRSGLDEGVVERIVDALGEILEELDLDVENDQVVVEVLFDDGAMDALHPDMLLLDDALVDDELDAAADEDDEDEEDDGAEEGEEPEEGDDSDAEDPFSLEAAAAGPWTEIRRAAYRLADAWEAAVARGAQGRPCRGCRRL